MSVSANSRVPLKVIEDFLRSRGEYILKVLDRYSKRAESALTPIEYNSGDKIAVLGEEYTLSVLNGERNFALLDGETFSLTVWDTNDTELKRKTVDKLLCELCRKAVNEICERIYPEFKEYVPEYPVIKFRRMRTKWGICRPTRNEITFSYMLSAAPLDCIEYVIFHEFCHFIHPDHSKNFYARLSLFVPDWKARKERLEKVSILK
jgi:predicted metal-dependent hydrolase